MDDDRLNTQLLEKLLNYRFHIKDLCSLKYFLRLEIDRITSSIFVNQNKNKLSIFWRKKVF